MLVWGHSLKVKKSTDLPAQTITELPKLHMIAPLGMIRGGKIEHLGAEVAENGDLLIG